VYYPKTLGAQTAIGRLALEPPWVNGLLRLLIGMGAPEWLRRLGGHQSQSRLRARIKRAHAERDRFALLVRVERAGKTMAMCLTGRHQAEVTAAGAAELCRMLVMREVSAPGVWLPEQVVPTAAFFAAIERLGWQVQLV
jgi:hypothetical protein